MDNTKKALLVTTVSGFVPQFELSNVRILQSMGYEVHYAANYNTPSYGNNNHKLNGSGIVRHQVDFVRNPIKFKNIKVYRQLRKIMTDEQFQVVHCHTPMGGVMARLAAYNTNTYPVIYTAHGFHFFAGAPFVNWVCYYPAEKLLSYITDQLICINQEDYEFARKHFHAKYIDYTPGVGIDLHKIHNNVEIGYKKKELGIPTDRVILLSAGELIKRKNHETVIRALAQLKKEISGSADKMFQYIICGHGVLQDYLLNLSKELNVADCISFLGYREDIEEIYQIADLFLFPSFQEGLPMAMLEAMAYGLPVICSDIRGNRDLMEVKTNRTFEMCAGGIVIKYANDIEAYCQAIKQLMHDDTVRKEMGRVNTERAKQFSCDRVKETMTGIYSRILKNKS